MARALDRPIDIDTPIATPTATPRLPRPTRPPWSTPHVLVVTHDLGYGGGQIWLLDSSTRTGAGRDFPATVVSPASGPLAATLRRLGITVHVSGAARDRPAGCLRGAAGRVGRRADPQGFTHVLVNTLLGFAGADLASRLGLPSIWAIHESGRRHLPSVSLTRRAASIVMFSTRRCARWRRRALSSSKPRPPARCMRTTPAPVPQWWSATACAPGLSGTTAPPKGRESARKQLGLTVIRRIVLVMGTVEPRKGADRTRAGFPAGGATPSRYRIDLRRRGRHPVCSRPHRISRACRFESSGARRARCRRLRSLVSRCRRPGVRLRRREHAPVRAGGHGLRPAGTRHRHLRATRAHQATVRPACWTQVRRCRCGPSQGWSGC